MKLVNAMSQELTLKIYLKEVKKGYDYALIDCMQSQGMLVINGLTVADSVIVPVQLQINPSLKVDEVLLTLVDLRTNLMRITTESIRQNYGRVIKVY